MQQIGYKGCLSVYDRVEKFGLEETQKWMRRQHPPERVERIWRLIRDKKMREEGLSIPNFYEQKRRKLRCN
jgi:hypothetical protein